MRTDTTASLVRFGRKLNLASKEYFRIYEELLNSSNPIANDIARQLEASGFVISLDFEVLIKEILEKSQGKS